VIGFVLGPIFEVNLRRTTMLTGDDTLGYLAGRPITLVIFGLVILSLLFPAFQAVYARQSMAVSRETATSPVAAAWPRAYRSTNKQGGPDDEENHSAPAADPP